MEIEKVIGHERCRNGSIRFLCKWEGFSDEDATYRTTDDFKTSPYEIQVVKNYVLSFDDTPEELKEWVLNTDWIHGSVVEEWNKREGVASSTSEVLGAQQVSNEGSEEA